MAGERQRAMTRTSGWKSYTVAVVCLLLAALRWRAGDLAGAEQYVLAAAGLGSLRHAIGRRR